MHLCALPLGSGGTKERAEWFPKAGRVHFWRETCTRSLLSRPKKLRLSQARPLHPPAHVFSGFRAKRSIRRVRTRLEAQGLDGFLEK